MPERSAPRDTCARWFATLVAATLLLAIGGGCDVKESQHGHQLPQGIVAALQEPNVTQDQVLQLLGTPTTRSSFELGTWYYISEVQQTYAFFQPETVDRTVLILHFDNNRTLERIATLSKEDGAEVTLVARETPTEGHKLTLLEQLIGNIGRFNTSGG